MQMKTTKNATHNTPENTKTLHNTKKTYQKLPEAN